MPAIWALVRSARVESGPCDFLWTSDSRSVFCALFVYGSTLLYAGCDTTLGNSCQVTSFVLPRVFQVPSRKRHSGAYSGSHARPLRPYEYICCAILLEPHNFFGTSLAAFTNSCRWLPCVEPPPFHVGHKQYRNVRQQPPRRIWFVADCSMTSLVRF
jgi:hypothetical protein